MGGALKVAESSRAALLCLVQITAGHDRVLDSLRDLIAFSIPHTVKLALVHDDEDHKRWILSSITNDDQPSK